MNRIFYVFTIVLTISINLFSQNSAADYLLRAESDPQIVENAILEASRLNQPKSIYLPEGIFINLAGLENGKPVYVVMYDLANPYNGCELMDFSQIQNSFNLSSARLVFADGRVTNETLGYPEPVPARSASFLLFMESSIARVSALDPVTGDVVNLNYLTDALLSTPKQARLSPWGFISISDQVLDVVNKYDTLGTFISVFAPAGGANTSIMDNIRGHNYKDGKLLVTVGAGANQNTVASFDSTGTFTGNFIAQGAGGIASPYDVIFRTGDVLVSAYTSKKIHRFDLAGNFLNDFATTINFPQQIVEAPNGDILCADFGVGGGLRIYSSTGELLNLFNFVTTNRGAWKLGDGNYLTTNAAGLYKLSPTGVMLDTIISGVQGQYISPYDRSVIPVEFSTFNANVINGNVDLSWSTASETNNMGFDIERSSNNISWKKIGFVKGSGTTTEKKNYSFRDKNPGSGKNYYRLKQMDFNGAFDYSKVQMVETAMPQNYSLEQNYPNPFNPVTNIKFSIPVDQFVSIEVFNVIGQKVGSVFSGNVKAGTHTVSFNSSGLNSGIYYYKISAGNFSAVKKMIVMK